MCEQTPEQPEQSSPQSSEEQSQQMPEQCEVDGEFNRFANQYLPPFTGVVLDYLSTAASESLKIILNMSLRECQAKIAQLDAKFSQPGTTLEQRLTITLLLHHQYVKRDEINGAIKVMTQRDQATDPSDPQE
jgi:hypothetical protein